MIEEGRQNRVAAASQLALRGGRVGPRWLCRKTGYLFFPQQSLYIFPEPHGQGSVGLGFAISPPPDSQRDTTLFNAIDMPWNSLSDVVSIVGTIGTRAGS